MNSLPRCEVVPLPNHQVSFRIDGVEKTRWHFGTQYPRPFFFPLNGPSGETLTRMGHPGAENHEHHRSVWFAHSKLLGINFWGDQTDAIIRQKTWLDYQDGDSSCAMAVQLDWLDGHDPRPLVEQEMIAVLRPLERGEYTLDLQSTFRPNAEQIEFQQSNFGFLAVRVAKSISSYFGSGTITGASGDQGEPALFGKSNPWMDYSGPVPVRNNGGPRESVVNGITFFDHPQNVNYPAKWHVREDGWMGPSACRDHAIITKQSDPVRLRYLLHVHQDGVSPSQAESIVEAWVKQPMLKVIESEQSHRQYEIVEV